MHVCTASTLAQCLEAEHATYAIMSLRAMRSEAHMQEKAAQKYNNTLFTGHGYHCAIVDR